MTVGRIASRGAVPLGLAWAPVRAAHRLLTSAGFAVVQIVVIATAAVVGMTVRQLPGFAFRTQADYLEQVDLPRERSVPALGRPVVDVTERLGPFVAWWFDALLVLSIVVCTLDRVPRLWRGAADIRVVRPDPSYDPTLPERAAMTGLGTDGLGADAVTSVLRRRRFGVGRAETADATHIYGDRNRWMRLATLPTHAGVVLTFYFPPRREWVRIDRAGELRLAWISHRYVPVSRELDSPLGDLVAVPSSGDPLPDGSAAAGTSDGSSPAGDPLPDGPAAADTSDGSSPAGILSSPASSTGMGSS